MRAWTAAAILTTVIAAGGLAASQGAWSQTAGASAGDPAQVTDPSRPPPPDWMRHRGRFGAGPMLHRMRMFALVYPAKDRNLSAADVQHIAEAFLLWNGNHTWKVTGVQEQGDAVAFSLAAQDGTAIAGFTMDRHTGHLQRTS